MNTRTNQQLDKWPYTQMDRDKWKDGQTDRWTKWQIDTQIDGQTTIPPHTHAHTHMPPPPNTSRQIETRADRNADQISFGIYLLDFNRKPISSTFF
jgi:hypothetical protein